MSRIDLNGLISKREAGFFWLATRLAGPEPIDLPNKIIELSGMPCTIVK
jgi:hypothetical protein